MEKILLLEMLLNILLYVFSIQDVDIFLCMFC
jgi:hypothetical protein